METQPRLCSPGVNPGTASYTSRPLGTTDSTAPLAAASDLHIARTARTNLLIVGPEGLVRNVLDLVAPEVRKDATVHCQGGLLQLPPTSRPATIVVRDVDELNAADQRRLLEWLNAGNTRTQAISTASVPLLPLVQSRRFNDTLYYRLNTIYVDLSE